MQSALNKPFIEVESNQTTRNTSIDAQTVLKKTVIFWGAKGRGMEGVKTEIRLKMPSGNSLNKPYMEVEGNRTIINTLIDG